MKLSILITAYNAESTLKRCIDSLILSLNEEIEIIVVDDGSQDKTAQILLEYEQIKVIHQQNGGVSKARNTALDAAAGEYITYLILMILRWQRLIQICCSRRWIRRVIFFFMMLILTGDHIRNILTWVIIFLPVP